jgi:uroporphyrin-III C-methyltransferase
MEQASGTTAVYLVGSGPGGVDLLTVKAMRLLTKADWIIHDALVNPEILELAPQARLISVGKRANKASPAQTEINALLVRYGQLAKSAGKIVVRLKGGDPLIFARAEEEIDALRQADLDFEIVPGITAAQAAHASIKQPLTRRGHQRAFVLATPQVQTGDEIGTAWARPIVAAQGGAIYMAASAASRIKGTLIALGLPAHIDATWVANAGRADERVTVQTLATLSAPEQSSNAAVLLLIGAAPLLTAPLRSSLTYPRGLGDAACATPSLRSDEYARE